MKIDKKQLYTTEETAKILKVSPITVKRYIADEDLAKILSTKKKNYAK